MISFRQQKKRVFSITIDSIETERNDQSHFSPFLYRGMHFF